MSAAVRVDRVLVVEDSPEIRHVWRRVLTSAGFEVIESEDGAHGVEHARRAQPDVIVMDINLPVLDGIGAIECLKRDRTTAAVPVVVVSGDVFAADRALEAGGEMFLAKPVRADTLLQAVQHVLARPRQASTANSPAG
jgi:CheY-like chemotaxis protein